MTNPELKKTIRTLRKASKNGGPVIWGALADELDKAKRGRVDCYALFEKTKQQPKQCECRSITKNFMRRAPNNVRLTFKKKVVLCNHTSIIISLGGPNETAYSVKEPR